MKLTFVDLGLVEYAKAWDYQEQKMQEVITAKSNSQDGESQLIFCEHPHVFTLGKSGVQNNLLVNEQYLKSINATFFKTNRGGDITYHGPGQIVGYPILNLEAFNLGVRDYIFKLEEVIIRTLESYGLQAGRLDNATGVWLDTDSENQARKICAIGVRVSRYVSMHGFALNVNTDLDYFSHINPCGFTDKGVTSLQKEMGQEIDMAEVKEKLKANFSHVFQLEILQHVE